MDKKLPNFRHMDAQAGSVYGHSNVVRSINPDKCYFIAHYPNGKVIKGNNLFDTGWDNIPDGISKLQYKLSTGHIINIPKYKAYLPLIEASSGINGSRIFHSININCMGNDEVFVYKIILKQDNISKYKIGDIMVSKSKKVIQSSYWKFSS